MIKFKKWLLLIPLSLFTFKTCQASVYEVLVVNKERPGFSAKLGQVVCANLSGYNWKNGEKADFFSIISFLGTEAELSEILNGDYSYDFVTQKFVQTDTKQKFNKEVAVTKQDAPVFKPVIEHVATDLDPTWQSKEKDVCKFLHPSHLPYNSADFNPTRRYWFNKIRDLKGLPGIKELRAAILFRDYGNIAEAGRSLPKETRGAILTSKKFAPDDIKWLKWLWKVKDNA